MAAAGGAGACAGGEVAGETGQQWQGQGLPQAAAPFITVGMDRQRGKAGPGFL